MERVNFIPCLAWVKQGKAKSNVEKVKHTKEELQEIVKELKLKEAEYGSRPSNEPTKTNSLPSSQENSDQEEEDEISKRYEMDNYDDDDDNTGGNGMLNNLGATGYGLENLILNNPSESDSEDSDADQDEFTVKPDDNLILMGHVESDVCTLEVYVFNNAKAELFILHDIFLPSYPICIEWLDFNPKESGSPGNYAAVGCMTPEIDVWDLGVSGCLESAFQLGGRKTKKSQRHKDAVLDLTWNPLNRNVLASASADNSVLLWDLSQLTSVLRLSQFEDKVQAAKFHNLEPHSLLTGACDGKIRLYDCRSPTTFKTWAFDGEIERVIWNPFNPNCYFASTEKGMVHQVDIRNSDSLWTLKAHDQEVSGLAQSSHCKDILVTGGMDEAVKVWDLKDNKPQFVTQKSMNIGQILTLQACPNVPYVFCAGGNKKDNFMYLWDIRENDTVLQRFKDRNLEEVTFTHGTKPNPGVKEEPMDAATTTTSTEPQPCSSSSLLSSRPQNNQARFEGALKNRKNQKNKVLEAMKKDEATAAASRTNSNSSRNKKKKDHKKLHPKTKDKE